MKFCDECEHFGKPLEFKPGRFVCSKGHEMKFKIMEDLSFEFGFYLDGCKDRAEIGQEAAKF